MFTDVTMFSSKNGGSGTSHGSKIIFCWRFFRGPPLAHGDPAPLGPKECKLKGEELVSYQFICMCWSKSQSISRVLMLMPRLFECNWLISEQTGNIRQYFHFLQTLQHCIENFPQRLKLNFRLYAKSIKPTLTLTFSPCYQCGNM